MANAVEATLRAKGTATADILTQADQQGMVFIEQAGISLQMLHKKRLIGTVATIIRCQTDAVDDALSISVNNKNRLVSRIEYYGIGGLLSNTVDRKKLPTELVRATGKELTQVVIIVFPQPVNQSLELARLSVIVTTGTDKGSHFGQADAA